MVLILRNCAVLLLAATLRLSCFPAVCAQELPELGAKSAVIMSGAGELLYGLEPDLMLPVASTTKLMTALVVLEHCDPEQVAEIRSEWCGAEGSSMYLRPGDRYTVRELLTGLLLVSGNDAAVALANICAGDMTDFVAMMNDRAKSLGMKNTHYLNPHGLNEAGHYSTARDLATLMIACMENPLFFELIGLKSATVGEQVLINHNRLLARYPGCIGGKTGYTQVAGRCLVSCAERGGTRFVCVTLSDPDDWNDHVRLYDWAFSRFEERVLTDAELGWKVPVLCGERDSVSVVPAKDLRFLVPKDQELTVSAELPYYVFAPVVRADVAGSISVYLQEDLLAQADLIYTEDVAVK